MVRCGCQFAGVTAAIKLCTASSAIFSLVIQGHHHRLLGPNPRNHLLVAVRRRTPRVGLLVASEPAVGKRHRERRARSLRAGLGAACVQRAGDGPAGVVAASVDILGLLGATGLLGKAALFVPLPVRMFVRSIVFFLINSFSKEDRNTFALQASRC